jgi:hypothetical protein
MELALVAGQTASPRGPLPSLPNAINNQLSNGNIENSSARTEGNPPVSQICALTVFPSTLILRVANSTPIVDFESRLNSLRVKRDSTDAVRCISPAGRSLAHGFYSRKNNKKDGKLVMNPLWWYARFSYTGVTDQDDLKSVLGSSLRIGEPGRKSVASDARDTVLTLNR